MIYKWLNYSHAIRKAMPCLLCGIGHNKASPICSTCCRVLPKKRQHCQRCGDPLEVTREACGRCLSKAPVQQLTLAPYWYRSPVKQMIQKAKFAGDLAMLRPLIDELASLVEQTYPGAARPDAIISVPMHRSRLHQRGYNQAEEIAARLANKLKIPEIRHGLERTRATELQSALDPKQRKTNVRNAFALRLQAWPAHIAIVDDIKTTGATLRSVALELRRRGVARIDYWCLAQTRRSEH